MTADKRIAQLQRECQNWSATSIKQNMRIAELETEIAELLAMLERLEWVRNEGGGPTYEYCTVCHAKRREWHRHAPNCELAALLKKARGE